MNKKELKKEIKEIKEEIKKLKKVMKNKKDLAKLDSFWERIKIIENVIKSGKTLVRV